MTTTEDVIRLALDTDCTYINLNSGDMDASLERLRHLISLAKAEEREACAQIAEHFAKALDGAGGEYTRSRECQQAAAAIRARTQGAT